MTVLQEIEVERAKQIARGFTAAHDDAEHPDGKLATVAAGLLLGQDDGWGIMQRHQHDPRQRLIIAAALIVAEVQRLDRRQRQQALANMPKEPALAPTVSLDALQLYEGARRALYRARINTVGELCQLTAAELRRGAVPGIYPGDVTLIEGALADRDLALRETEETP